jgi:hypothetical protein
MRTLQSELCGQTLVIAHSTETPSDAEWAAWIERMGQRDYRNIMILSRGGGPNAQQRRLTNKFWIGKEVPRFALVTTSRFVIGIMKAFNWFLDDKLKPFHPTQFDRALDYLEVAESDREPLRHFAETFSKQLEHQAA